MSKWRKFLCTSLKNEDGQALVEYSLIIALIGLVAIVGLSAMGGDVDGLYGVVEELASAMSGALGG